MLFWSTWFIGSFMLLAAAQEPAQHSALWTGHARCNSTPRPAWSHHCQTLITVKPAVIIKNGTLMLRRVEFDPQISCGHQRPSSEPPLPRRGMCSPAVMLGWRLWVGGWVFLCAGNELSKSKCEVSLTLSRGACWGLATSWVCCSRTRATEVLPQPPRAPPPQGRGLGTKLVLKYPTGIVPTESWKGISQRFVQDEYCQAHNGASQIWSHFPARWFHILLFFKQWVIFPLYLEICLIFVI